jgi:hypothetical protein
MGGGRGVGKRKEAAPDAGWICRKDDSTAVGEKATGEKVWDIHRSPMMHISPQPKKLGGWLGREPLLPVLGALLLIITGP